MNEIIVRTNKGEYAPGEDICGAVYLRIISPTAGRGVQLKFTGFESFCYQLQKDADTSECFRERKDYINYEDVKLLELEAPLSIGNRLIPFRIHLPVEIPGTFMASQEGGDLKWTARVEYLLQARVIDASQLQAVTPIIVCQSLARDIVTSDPTPAVSEEYLVTKLLFFKERISVTGRLKQHVYRTGESLLLRIIITNNTSIGVATLTIRLIRKIIFMYKRTTVSVPRGERRKSEASHKLSNDEKLFIFAEDGCVVREQELDMTSYPHGLDNFRIPLRNMDNSCIYPTVRGLHVHCDYVVEITVRLSDGNSFPLEVPVSVIQAQKCEQWRTWMEPDWLSGEDLDTHHTHSVFSVPDNVLTPLQHILGNHTHGGPPPLGLGQDKELCYCGKGRNLGSVELQCTACGKWYHADCTSCYLGTCIPFMCNYVYSCKHCNDNALESFQRKQASFQQICYTTLANLTFLSNVHGESRVMFSKDKEIIPFVDTQWENLTTMPRRTKLTWHTTIHKTLAKETDIFFGNETAAAGTQFGLLNSDLYKVTPAFEILTKGNTQIQATTKPGQVVDKGLRGQKRKTTQEVVQPTHVKTKKGELLNLAKLAPHGYPLEHPYNKDGYRYILAEPDPHAPNRREYDESVEWAGKPIPAYLYRIFLGSEVLLAMHDRAPQLKLSEDRLSVTGEKGYCMIRASHGVKRGSWYYEVIVNEMPENAAIRIGWSQMLGNLQAPCGYDKFSYSWRSRKGTKFHQSRGRVYSAPYREGDVVGVHISLPEPSDPHLLLPATLKDKPLVKFKNHLYYEEKDAVAESERALTDLPGSKVAFYKNGKPQGVAYEDIFEGVYYPAISLYKATKVTVNFGPNFKYHPQKIGAHSPICVMAEAAMVENALADTLFHVENEGNLPEF